MLFIVVRLVGEEQDRLFRNIILEPQISRLELMKKIESVTRIPPEFQQIEFRSEKLPDSLHPLESINDLEELVVKHSLLESWRAYLLLCDSAKDIKKEKPERKKCAQRAIANSQKLEDSGFFDAYVNFVTVWEDTIDEMIRFVDENDFEQSATKFFTKMFPNSTISFKSKQGGSRAGIVVTVTFNGEETIYFMKTCHHFGSSIFLRNTSKRHLQDLREMFAYRLLEHIGVGPVVFFPFYDESKYIHYIATKEVKEFKELEKIEDVVLQNKVVVEAYLLSLILGIRDLHEGNIGSTKEKALSIIDFYAPDTDNSVRRRILDDLKNKSNFGGLGKANEILTEIGHEERMKIAKDALPHWSRIKSITTDIIGIEKSELQEHGIKIGYDVEDYLQDIKLNYDSICLAFQ